MDLVKAIEQALDILGDPRECRAADIAKAKVILKRALRRERAASTSISSGEVDR